MVQLSMKVTTKFVNSFRPEEAEKVPGSVPRNNTERA
jgi:hypothetical protein